MVQGAGTKDDIDHLGNRRLRCVGELLQNQFRVGFTRLERVIRERMTVQDLDVVTPQSLSLIHIWLCSIAFTSQLSVLEKQVSILRLQYTPHTRKLQAEKHRRNFEA